MTQLRKLVVIGAVATAFLQVNIEAQRKQKPPSIAFGTAEVSLGMSVEQLQMNLSESARHIEFLSDKHTALIRVNNVPVPSGDEGQVTFFDGRVVYAAFHFPDARDAHQLAQEIAGAVENMDTKVCTVSNWSSHGTGGGLSQTILDCGSKSFNVMTTEILGHNERYTHVEITIGAIPRPK
ncbi:MAG TPA: hypothetical protein VGR03_09745 [Candidatus Acidoferrum sp.]|nr:hypothetical protein [Candidatus Acidoferrum sp.]